MAADLLHPRDGLVGEVPVDEADQQALQLTQVLDDEAPVIRVVNLKSISVNYHHKIWLFSNHCRTATRILT